MNDEQAFIDACLRQPQDNLVKLVFADWLEEQGRSTEAWRLRTYLEVYRPQWWRAIRWDRRITDRWCKRRVRATVRMRNDPLWRLVNLTLLDAVLERRPLRLEVVPWQQAWSAERYCHTLAAACSRIVLCACGINANLDAAWLAAWRANQAASPAAETPPARLEGWRTEFTAEAVAQLAWQAEGLPVFQAPQNMWIVADLAPIHEGWSGLHTVWTHIRNTNPAW